MKLDNESKSNIEFYVSVITLMAGLVLLFVGIFIAPKGEIHYSVLTSFGEIATFVGCVWGIAYKYQSRN